MSELCAQEQLESALEAIIDLKRRYADLLLAALSGSSPDRFVGIAERFEKFVLTWERETLFELAGESMRVAEEINPILTSDGMGAEGDLDAEERVALHADPVATYRNEMGDPYVPTKQPEQPKPPEDVPAAAVDLDTTSRSIRDERLQCRRVEMQRETLRTTFEETTGTFEFAYEAAMRVLQQATADGLHVDDIARVLKGEGRNVNPDSINSLLGQRREKGAPLERVGPKTWRYIATGVTPLAGDTSITVRYECPSCGGAHRKADCTMPVATL